MICTQHYASPLGGILIAADEQGLTGLWFDNQKYFADTLPKDAVAQSTPILADAARWLDIYFSGREPDFLPPLHPQGSAFRQAVWALLLQIPYGKTVTYGELSHQIAAQRGLAHMSAQAVGGAVGLYLGSMSFCHGITASFQLMDIYLLFFSSLPCPL